MTFTPTALGAVPSTTLNVTVGATTLPLTLTGTGVQPLYLNASTLVFGNEGVGMTSVAKTVSLYNYTGATVSPVISLPVGASFAASGCAKLLNNASCSLSVTFTPTALGAVPSTTLNVTVGATTLPLTLTGTGVQPLYLNASALAFGNEGVGMTSVAKAVSLYNYTGATVSPVISLPVGASFAASGCASVANNASCSVSVAFTPTALGAVPSTTLSVTVGATTLPLTLTGTGVQPLYLNASALAFGNEGVGVTSVAKTVSLYNYSGATVSPVISLPVGASFAASGCANLLNNASCSFPVTFTPTALGAVPSTTLSVRWARLPCPDPDGHGGSAALLE